MQQLSAQFAAALAKAGFVESFFRESSVGLNLCRLDGHWLASNPAFLRIIGYEAAEADDGRLTYWQLTPRKYDADEALQLRKLSTEGRYGPYEKEFIRKDGTLVSVRLNGFIVEVDGEKMIWSFIEDITAERTLEMERLKAIQASKLVALGELAASIAHEVNNPLSVISAFAHLLPDAIARGDRPLVDEALGAIREATERAGAITTGLRRLARGTSELAFEPVLVPLVIDEVSRLTGARTRSEGLELELEVRTGAHVWGNQVQLGQVLINLVNNAIDAVRDQPTRRVAVRALDDSAEVQLRVEDTGRGIADEHRERAFDRFFTTKGARGTGLGLAVSRDIIQSMGGTLVYEREGARTVFTARLPRFGGGGQS
ncbi:MAG: PAS domain S-box protein [Myxococcaceae bacterium]|nr:PAS domain S-box protein [Myxococcaceae bacterium]